MTLPLAVKDGERQRTQEIERLFGEGLAAPLIERLTDSSWTVRRAVVSALSRLGDRSIGALCEVLSARRDDENRVAAVVDALVGSVGDVEPAVLALTESSEPAVVCDAAQILGRRRSSVAMSKLASLVQHADENIALSAIEAVGRIGGQTAVDLLIAAVQSRNFFRVFPAIDVLGRTGDPRVVAPLCQLLSDPHYAIEATRALGRAGLPSAMPRLAALLLKPNDAQVRVTAIALVAIDDRFTVRFGPHRAVTEALATIDTGTAGRRLTHALVGADSNERTALCRVLGWIGGNEAARALVELLDAEPAAAAAAAAAIATLDGNAEPILLAALHESTEERRLMLLPILARSRTAAPDIVACLDDPHASVRAVACDTLGKLGDTAAVPVLFEHLADSDARVSQAAVAAIQSLGGTDVEHRALQAAQSSDPRLRRSALRILAYFGWPSAWDAFLKAMEDSDERLCDIAASGLANIDDDRSIEVLIALASHPSARRRAASVRALGRTHDDANVHERLRASLSDPDAWVRYYACQAVGRQPDEASAEAVAALLNDPAGHVRVAAIEALAQLHGERALEALHAAARSSDPDVQRAALLGLGSVHNPTSLPAVRAAVQLPDAATRLVALSALAQFEGPEVVSGLVSAMSDSDENVRHAAVALLGTRRDVESTAALVRGLDIPVLSDAIQSALSTWSEGRIQGLRTALRTASETSAPFMISALARMRRPEAMATLEEAFAFDSAIVRRAVIPALSALGTASARNLLEHASRSDLDAQVREICAAVLGN